MMSSNFDLENRHYGVDIAANPNESVLATLDGTVICLLIQQKPVMLFRYSTDRILCRYINIVVRY